MNRPDCGEKSLGSIDANDDDAKPIVDVRGEKNSNEAQKNDMISNIIITGREVAFSSR